MLVQTKLLEKEQNLAIDLLTIGLYTADLALALDSWSGPRIISMKFVGQKGPPQREKKATALGSNSCWRIKQRGRASSIFRGYPADKGSQLISYFQRFYPLSLGHRLGDPSNLDSAHFGWNSVTQTRSLGKEIVTIKSDLTNCNILYLLTSATGSWTIKKAELISVQ